MSDETATRCIDIHVLGVVQGVGFRPFVYRLALEHGLSGWVRNTSEGVDIHVQGVSGSIDAFLASLRNDAPPLAKVHGITASDCQPRPVSGFEIRESVHNAEKGQLVSPDVATCDDCLHEMLDPSNRRFHYAFTNCTNCGPRFTIITDMPYDRPSTTMRAFTMCPRCQAEYDNPADRRFHAQPNACPVCGPQLSLARPDGSTVTAADPVAEAARALKAGAIVAVKGLGGFLLACDATSPDAVERLRERKGRPSKPFAVMVRDIPTAREHCDFGEREAGLLTSPAAPIVLMRWRTDSAICEQVAPRLLYLGVMLPYTPLHHLLLRAFEGPLVMTSGNLSEEPIVADNEEALERLSNIADLFLMHNRPIHSRYDDSVAMVVDDTTQMLRRARGYAPYPVDLSIDAPQILAVGPQTKNTFCLTKGRHAFVSQHIGDLDSIESLDHFRSTISLYERLFRVRPEAVAHDLHPDYLSTHYARELHDAGLHAIAVQHHHAHIAACMVENGVAAPVIGVAYDGAGLGTDGTVWGGEFLLCGRGTFRRVAHLRPLPLAGGDAATLRPARTATGFIARLFGEDAAAGVTSLASAITPEERHVIAHQVASGLNSPLTSSMGRLFDAVSAITGLRRAIDYEGQAAIEFEMEAHKYGSSPHPPRYAFEVHPADDGYVIDTAPVLEAVTSDAASGQPVPLIAAMFHEAVATMTVDVCGLVARDSGISTVALSGGVFQNRLLLATTMQRLRYHGLNVIVHTQLPANDGCISLGQAAVAAYMLRPEPAPLA